MASAMPADSILSVDTEEKIKAGLRIIAHPSQIEEEEDDEEERRFCHTCRKGPRTWCLKYFCEGQNFSAKQQKLFSGIDPHMPLVERVIVTHRRLLAVLLPATIIHIFWWAFMLYHDTWWLFRDRYQLTITMVFGSLLAGMTSVGGGLLAFSVMTFALDLDPSIARDFSVMMQSFGMSAASFAIIFMRLQVEWTTVSICLPTGAVGLIFGLHVVDHALSPDQKKMIFASTWLSFSSIIFLLNHFKKRRTFGTIPNFCWWKGLVLALTGFCGGLFTSFAGSGLEMSTFAILALLFRVTEKTATPTAIILMASVSVIAWIWEGLMLQELTSISLDYLVVTVPVVVIGAPIGSLMGSYFHRVVLATLLCVVNVASLIGAYVATELTWQLVVMSVGIIVGMLATFVLVTLVGQRILRSIEKKEMVHTDISFNSTRLANGNAY